MALKEPLQATGCYWGAQEGPGLSLLEKGGSSLRRTRQGLRLNFTWRIRELGDSVSKFVSTPIRVISNYNYIVTTFITLITKSLDPPSKAAFERALYRIHKGHGSGVMVQGFSPRGFWFGV